MLCLFTSFSLALHFGRLPTRTRLSFSLSRSLTLCLARVPPPRTSRMHPYRRHRRRHHNHYHHRRYAHRLPLYAVLFAVKQKSCEWFTCRKPSLEGDGGDDDAPLLGSSGLPLDNGGENRSKSNITLRNGLVCILPVSVCASKPLQTLTGTVYGLCASLCIQRQ